VELDEKIEAELLVGEHPSRQSRRLNELYNTGKHRTRHNVLEALANIQVFFTFVSPDYPDSALATALKSFESLLTSADGVAWANYHAKFPEVFLNLLISVQMIFAPFMALGNTAEYRNPEAVIDPSAFKSPSLVARSIVQEITAILPRLSAGPYTELPTTLTTVSPEFAGKPRASSSTDPKQGSKSTNNTSQPPAKVQKVSDNRPSPSTKKTSPASDPTTKGLLIYKGTGNNPSPTSVVVTRGDKKLSLCPQFLFQGTSCRYGRDCKKYHLANPADLDMTDTKIFNEWVKSTPGVEFANSPSVSFAPGTKP
jgi:hypothetical protein